MKVSKFLIFARDYSSILAWALATWSICGWSPRGWAASIALAIVLGNVGYLLYKFMFPGGTDGAEDDRQ